MSEPVTRYEIALSRLQPEHRMVIERLVYQPPEPLSATQKMALDDFLIFLRATP